LVLVHSVRRVRFHRCAKAFDRGLCGGVWMTSVSLSAKTASKAVRWSRADRVSRP
jgi:hypothetical protein